VIPGLGFAIVDGAEDEEDVDLIANLAREGEEVLECLGFLGPPE
jgi:hypothetical protein